MRRNRAEVGLRIMGGVMLLIAAWLSATEAPAEPSVTPPDVPAAEPAAPVTAEGGTNNAGDKTPSNPENNADDSAKTALGAASGTPTTPASASDGPAKTGAARGLLRGLRFDDGAAGRMLRFIERTPKKASDGGEQPAAATDEENAARKPAPATELQSGEPGKAPEEPNPLDEKFPPGQRAPVPAATGKIPPSLTVIPAVPDVPPEANKPGRLLQELARESQKMEASARAEETPAGSIPAEKPAGDELAADKPAGDEAAGDESLLDGIHAASFQGVVPGTTSEQEVVELLGQPRSRDSRGQAPGQITVLTYELGPFPRVDIHVAAAADKSAAKVRGVVVHLGEPAALNDVVSELKLADFASCRVPGPEDIGRGRSFPDRGIQLLYDKQSNGAKVSDVLLQVVSAEPFVWRAEQATEADVEKRLRDVRIALRLEPGFEPAHGLAARLYGQVGDLKTARSHLRQAGELAEQPRYRLLEAELLGREGQADEALRLAREIRDTEGTPPVARARAECLLGHLLLASESDGGREALERHLAAVELAKKVIAETSDDEVRRSAHEVLVMAHLGAANDIARGQWRERHHAVERWIDVAGKHAESYAGQFGSDPFLQWQVLRAAVAAHLGLGAEGEPAEAVERILKFGEESLRQAESERQRAFVRRQLGEALFDAMRVAYSRNDYEQTRRWGEQAVGYLEPGDVSQALSAHEHYQLGRALFLVGSCHAHADQNHELAVVWYERALAHLKHPLPATATDQLGRHGQRFVTMGVSYWHAGSKDESMKLTTQGARWMEQAVKRKLLDEKTLAIPYNNLANMHQALGNGDEAKALTAKARRIESDGSRQR